MAAKKKTAPQPAAKKTPPAAKRFHGVVTSTEPAQIVAARRAFDVDAFPAPVEVGVVVTFVPVGDAATEVRIVEKRVVPRKYKAGLHGIVTAKSEDWARIAELPSLQSWGRDGGETAIGEELQVGDAVLFDIMAEDGAAWEVRLRKVTLP